MVLALQQAGRPSSRLYEIIHRVADRLEPEMRDEFLNAMRSVRGQADEKRLLAALRRKDIQEVQRALGLNRLRPALREGLERTYRRTLLAAGEANTREVVRAGVFEMAFDLTNPNATLIARRDVGTLITGIDNETRLAVRAITGDMFTSGVPPAEASRRIREVVGLTRPQAQYVRNFSEQLRTIQVLGPESDRLNELVAKATDRRLDGATKQRIRKAAREGNLTDDLIAEFNQRYSDSLLNRRARNIARTESMRAAHAGQQESWNQAVRRGQLDADRTRRQWIVTPDDRLRETHAAIPGMNAEGVKLDEPFETPLGALMYPPAGVNCRCSVGLSFSGGAGIL